MKLVRRIGSCGAVCSIALLTGCGGEASLGGGTTGSDGAQGPGGSGSGSGGTPAGTSGSRSTTEGSDGAGGDRPDAESDSDAASSPDPRFQIVEPPPGPTEIVAPVGVPPKPLTHKLQPGDRVFGNTSFFGASDDLSVVVGTASYYFFDASQNCFCWGARRQTFRYTEEGGIGAIGAPPMSVDDFPSGMSADASVIYGSLTYADLTPDLYRWTAASGTVGLQAPVGTSPTVLAFQDSSFLLSPLGNVSVDGKAMVARLEIGSEGRTVRWSTDAGWAQLSPRNGEVKATSDAGDAVLLGSSQGSQWWSPSTGPIEIGKLAGLDACDVQQMTSNGAVVLGRCMAAMDTKTWLFKWTRATGAVALNTAPLLVSTSMWTVNAGGTAHWGTMRVADQLGNRDVFYRFDEASGLSVLFDPQTDSGLDPVWASRDAKVVLAVYLPHAANGGEPVIPHFFRWTEAGGVTLLDAPPGLPYTLALTASRDGSLVAGFAAIDLDAQTAGDTQAIVWDSKGPRIVATELAAAGVDLHGLRLSKANVVQSAGATIRIVGSGFYPPAADSGSTAPQERVFIARLPQR